VTMTNEEILRSFKQAQNQAEQVRILADLNACDVDTIKEILLSQGVDARKLPRERKPAAPQKAAKASLPLSVLQVIDREMAGLRARQAEIEDTIPKLASEQVSLSAKLDALITAQRVLAEVYEPEGEK